MTTESPKGTLASPVRLLEMLMDRFGAFEAIAMASIKLARHVPEDELSMDLLVAKASTRTEGRGHAENTGGTYTSNLPRCGSRRGRLIFRRRAEDRPAYGAVYVEPGPLSSAAAAGSGPGRGVTSRVPDEKISATGRSGSATAPSSRAR